MSVHRFIGGVAVWLGMIFLAAPAFAQHSDIAVYVDAEDTITPFGDGGLEQRAFSRAFDFFGPPIGIFAGNDPGIQMSGLNPPPGFDPLPAASQLDVNLVPLHLPGRGVGNLLYWDGQSMDVEIGSAPPNHVLIVEDATDLGFSLDGSLTRHDGLVVGVTDANGGMHKHITFEVEDTTGADPSTGFYLFAWEFAMEGLEKSEPVLIGLSSPEIPSNVEVQFVDWLEMELPTIRIAGDFDDNGLYEVPDVDALVAAIAGGNDPVEFDLTLDGSVDLADLDLWRETVGAVLNDSGNPVLRGDANLDGFVDGQDFIDWNTHKFTETAAWSKGDFNADGFVDGQDFIIWNTFKFQNADAVSAVPEPHGMLLLAAAVGAGAFCRRRQKLRWFATRK